MYHGLTIDLVNTPSNAGNPNSYEYAISGDSGEIQLDGGSKSRLNLRYILVHGAFPICHFTFNLFHYY